MAQHWKPSAAPGHGRPPETIAGVARRYHACAVAFAHTLGIPLADALQAYHPPITAIFIESCRAGLRVPAGERVSQAEARELKRLAQTAFGFAGGERRLRRDLGLADDARLTLMRIGAHCTPTQYATLRGAYEAALRRAVERDVP
jgi:hypothetical protein